MAAHHSTPAELANIARYLEDIRAVVITAVCALCAQSADRDLDIARALKCGVIGPLTESADGLREIARKMSTEPRGQ